MKSLVIAEKPSVARDIARVLKCGKNINGAIEGDRYVVTWGLGHLVTLADPEDYDKKYKEWKMEDLPMMPEVFKLEVIKQTSKQYQAVKTQIYRGDVGDIIIATDAGREGELVARLILKKTGCNKPIRRLWISSVTDKAIREGFANLKDGREYNNLYDAAMCRAEADWLVGINATRLFSLLYGCTLNIGRVVSPTLALVVQREAEIATFQPEPFYMVELDCDGLSLAGDRKASKKEAQEAAARCQGSAAVVQSVERWEKTEKPPALFDLTTLQREANRTLGYTAQQTLDYLQALYDKKLSTYPRTDSRYLTDDMEAGVPALVEAAASICGVTAPETVLAGQVCDSARVSDHHAVVPTASAGKADLEALPIGEREILRLVSLGLLRAVCPPCRSAETCITAVCGGDPYTVKWRSVLSPGWKVYAQTADAEAGSGPDGLTEGQTLPVAAAQVKSGKTTPPKHHTEDSLLSAMEMAGKEDMPEDAERQGIGTPATRAAILEKLVSAGFVERKRAKKTVSLLPTPLGTALITVLPEQLQSPTLTAEWEHRLKEVERGTLAPGDFMDEIAAMLRELVETCRPVEGSAVLFPSTREAVGRCPRCGGTVTEGRQGFFCENRACGFAIWKNSKWWENKKKTPTKAIVAALLKDGRTQISGLWSEKTGKTYTATVALTDDGTRASFRLEFSHE